DEVIELIASDVRRAGRAEGVEQAGGSGDRLFALGRKIELDEVAVAFRGQYTAARVKTENGIAADVLAPDRVGRGERGVAAEIDFDSGSEPAKSPTIVAGLQVRRLGEVHLRGDVRHPLVIPRAVHETDGGGIALECIACERVDLEKLQLRSPAPPLP